MKYAIANEHREFFDRHQGIEFEDILDEEESCRMKHSIAHCLSLRLAVEETAVFDQSPLDLFDAGRDLWRESAAVKKIISQRSLAQLAFQLLGKRPFRLGYDQYFPPLKGGLRMGKYAEFLQNPSSLKDVSSLHGVVCGLFFSLHDSTEEKNESLLFPHQRGSGVILHPDAVIDWPFLLRPGSVGYYLIVYGTAKCLYMRNPADPLTGFLIPQGYASGDRLIDERNPIIFR